MDKERLKIRIAEIKADLSASLKDIQNGNDQRLGAVRDAMNRLPVNRIINAAQYIEKNLLPAVSRKSSDSSPDYVFFKEVVNLLLMSVSLHERMHMMQQMYYNQRIDMELLRERVLLYETMLQKFCTLEEVYMEQSLHFYEKGVAGRVEDMLNKSKKT